MSKIDIRYEIINSDIKIINNTTGIINNNELKYLEEDVIVIYNYKNNILKRDSKEFIMEYDFNKEIGYYLIKELDYKVNIDFKVKKLDINNNNIDIIYMVDKEKHEYKVEVLE